MSTLDPGHVVEALRLLDATGPEKAKAVLAVLQDMGAGFELSELVHIVDRIGSTPAPDRPPRSLMIACPCGQESPSDLNRWHTLYVATGEIWQERPCPGCGRQWTGTVYFTEGT